MPLIPDQEHAKHGWWAAGLVVLVTFLLVAAALTFRGVFIPSIPVTVTSDRAGLVMEPGGKVKLRGVEVGRVASIDARRDGVALDLALDPKMSQVLPANIEAQIRTTTLFGAKYVDLIYPDKPDVRRISAGARIPARNVTTEVNTVFESLTTVLAQVQPDKLNAVLTTFSDALRGKGERMAQATTAAADVLRDLNVRTDALNEDINALAAAGDAYATAARDIIDTVAAWTTTAGTINSQSDHLQQALLAATGLANAGIDLLAPSRDNFVHAFNQLDATTEVLRRYSPTFTCFLQGAHWLLTDGRASETNGRSNIVDIGFGFAQDPYRFPDHLPVVNARGGPDGKPGCGALPRPDLNMPVRYLVTDTGFGTGLDLRPNPGIAHPYLENYFPVTKAIPEPPRVYGDKPPAIGPVPYPGAPAYGAPLFAPDGAPLWAPPPPGAPPPPVPGIPVPPAPYGPGSPAPHSSPENLPNQQQGG